MLLLRPPTAEQVQAFRLAQRDRPFSYAEVGATRDKPPGGYFLDHRRTRLGTGAAAFERACAALARWEQFHLGWVQVHDGDTPLRAGEVVVVAGGRLRLWSLNARRIVYTIDDERSEPTALRRFGFAYGTLPDHVERGEERFMVEWRRDDDSVWYDLLAFSWPNHFVAQCCLPLMRRWQKRFSAESARAMQDAVDLSTAANFLR